MTFISVARSLESVGISAYLGAAHLLTDPALLTAAGSILTLEARHQSLFNVFNGESFGPQPFDIALSPSQVLALAGGFLEGCSAKDFGLTCTFTFPVRATLTPSSSQRAALDHGAAHANDPLLRRLAARLYLNGHHPAVCWSPISLERC